MTTKHPSLETELKNYQTALLIGVHFSAEEKKTCEENLEELVRLGETFGLRTVGKVPCALKKFDAATFLGKGKLEELKALAESLPAEVIIFDDEISPQQQRNLEQIFTKPVIDRTELIIEVFAKSAHTREARLQVELAKIKYQFPRLKRLWTHLSRQSSGGGGKYVKGEGEKQIEIDRRLLRRRVDRLQEEIEEILKTRETKRSARLRSGIPTFAIVGYTNAGKSTLLRALTKADVLVEDKLFATLDTTTRKFQLPHKHDILLIDTVGFIRKLPHALVVAFRSTLEEVVYTDILLHLVDISSPTVEAQTEAAYAVLKELHADERPIITVLNKFDACVNPLMIHKMRVKYPKTVVISAKTGEGFPELLEMMLTELRSLRKRLKLRVPQTHYALVSELMREGKVFFSEYEGNDIMLEVEIPHHLEHKVQPFLFNFYTERELGG